MDAALPHDVGSHRMSYLLLANTNSQKNTTRLSFQSEFFLAINLDPCPIPSHPFQMTVPGFALAKISLIAIPSAGEWMCQIIKPGPKRSDLNFC